MTALRTFAAPTGPSDADHRCGTSADIAGVPAAVLPFLDEGRHGGGHLLVTGAGPTLTRCLGLFGPHTENARTA